MLDLSDAIGDIHEQPASPSIILDSFEPNNEGLASSPSVLGIHQIHGILMCAAFGAILPLGVLAISWKPIASFQNHWIIQTFFTSTAFLGIYVALSNCLANGGV